MNKLLITFNNLKNEYGIKYLEYVLEESFSEHPDIEDVLNRLADTCKVDVATMPSHWAYIMGAWTMYKLLNKQDGPGFSEVEDAAKSS